MSPWRWFWPTQWVPGKDAAEAVLVDYQELPLVTDAITAMQPDAPKVWEELADNIGFLWKRGDAEATEAALGLPRMSRGCNSPCHASRPTRWSRVRRGPR